MLKFLMEAMMLVMDQLLYIPMASSDVPCTCVFCVCVLVSLIF